MCGHTRDLVIYSTFHQNPSRGFGATGVGISHFPYFGYWLLQHLVLRPSGDVLSLDYTRRWVQLLHRKHILYEQLLKLFIKTVSYTLREGSASTPVRQLSNADYHLGFCKGITDILQISVTRMSFGERSKAFAMHKW